MPRLTKPFRSDSSVPFLVRLEKMLSDHEAKSNQTDEGGTRLITGNSRENEAFLARTLLSINFARSKLPHSVLAHKTDPTQPWCDLEMTANLLVHRLRTTTVLLPQDIQKFDRSLLTLVQLFKQTVEQGHERMAHAANTCLLRAVMDCRERIPQVSREQVKPFIDANTDYLELCIQALSLVKRAEDLQTDADALQLRYQEYTARLDTEATCLHSDRQNDPALILSLMQLPPGVKLPLPHWTPAQKAFYSKVVHVSLLNHQCQLMKRLLPELEHLISKMLLPCEEIFYGAMPQDAVSLSEYTHRLFCQLEDQTCEIDRVIIPRISRCEPYLSPQCDSLPDQLTLSVTAEIRELLEGEWVYNSTTDEDPAATDAALSFDCESPAKEEAPCSHPTN